MELMDYKVINERFTSLRKLALEEEELPEAYRQSAADVEAYETCLGIFRDKKMRVIGKAELQARGNLARANYVARKRTELLDDVVYRNAQDAYKRASQLGAALCKEWTGTPEEMIDAVSDFIAALEGTDVTAKIIRSRMREVLLKNSEFGIRNSELRGAACGDAPKKTKPLPKKNSTPTQEEVKAYMRSFCQKKGVRYNEEEAEKCFDQYKANGWVQSNGRRITDWKATVRNWVRRIPEFKRAQQKESVYSSDASYDLEAYAKTAIGRRPPEKKEEATAS